ncbi:MAG: prepilin-type N-terminal cleavage/methylation domain-containing protein [Planctomycetes bacterium]|nr:prepilin-type N-terminal cleavage/methylation domain-containing protein [Planctomycetota bacterium]
MKLFNNSRNAARAGFSMIEMAISITILAILSGALAQSIEGVRNLTVSSNRRSTLQVSGNRALLDVVADLKNSGNVTIGGLEYPYVFVPGNAAPAFDAHDHVAAVSNGEAGDPDFGDSREIVFRIFDWAPDVATGEMEPNVSADGALIWDAEEISYRLITRADGINYLERLEDGANPRIVAHHVERVVFDDDESSGFTIPLGSIRVRLWMRDVDGTGHVQRYFTEAVVALTNQ